MKKILLFMLLFLSIAVVGQTKVKYIIQQDPDRYDFVLPVGYESIVQKAVHGKEQNLNMQIGNDDYWKKTVLSFRERYFTKEQVELFHKKKYSLTAKLVIDNVGNIKCVSFRVHREILETISSKQLNDVYQACWKLKVPMNSKWIDKNNYYSYIDAKLIHYSTK